MTLSTLHKVLAAEQPQLRQRMILNKSDWSRNPCQTFRIQMSLSASARADNDALNQLIEQLQHHGQLLHAGPLHHQLPCFPHITTSRWFTTLCAELESSFFTLTDIKVSRASDAGAATRSPPALLRLAAVEAGRRPEDSPDRRTNLMISSG